MASTTVDKIKIDFCWSGPVSRTEGLRARVVDLTYKDMSDKSKDASTPFSFTVHLDKGQLSKDAFTTLPILSRHQWTTISVKEFETDVIEIGVDRVRALVLKVGMFEESSKGLIRSDREVEFKIPHQLEAVD